jgi:hypothetical protein
VLTSGALGRSFIPILTLDVTIDDRHPHLLTYSICHTVFRSEVLGLNFTGQLGKRRAEDFAKSSFCIEDGALAAYDDADMVYRCPF